MKNDIKRPKAFTLIELLLTVVIIGIVAAIMYPNFEGMIIRGKLQEVYNTVELRRAAEQQYYFKTGTWFCFKYDSTGDGSGSDKQNYASYDTAEQQLGIKLPRNLDFCKYKMSTLFATTGPVVLVFVINPENSNNFDGIYMIGVQPGSTSMRNLDHPLSYIYHCR